MQALHAKYASKGLVIMAFPCNQFGNQESGTNQDIKDLAALYNVEFMLMDKIRVNGSGTHPVYEFLKRSKPGTLGTFIKWNFTKFLVNRRGHVFERYGPTIPPSDIESDIVRLLREGTDGVELKSSIMGEAGESDDTKEAKNGGDTKKTDETATASVETTTESTEAKGETKSDGETDQSSLSVEPLSIGIKIGEVDEEPGDCG